jgi:hypothetical protein
VAGRESAAAVAVVSGGGVVVVCIRHCVRVCGFHDGAKRTVVRWCISVLISVVVVVAFELAV